jgi:hypothetical protein
MPFERLIPHPVTEASARSYAPAVPGVYGLSTAREWIYIGQTDNILASVLEHLRDFESSAGPHQATGFVYEACSGEQRQFRLDRLIQEYAPTGIRGSKNRGGGTR